MVIMMIMGVNFNSIDMSYAIRIFLEKDYVCDLWSDNDAS